MTKVTLRVLITFGLLAISAAAASAQSSLSLHVHVPFNFTAGQANLPAGDYVVAQESNSGLILLQSQASKSAAAILTSNGDTPLTNRSPQLIFERRGERNVLTQIRVSDSPARVVPVALMNLGTR
mgnify:CR=1 FL=1